ncbi:serine hydrolase [Sphingomonas sp. Leaf357]|uniref:serine hydrolase n=1 Tax=Sphingomonas sp. Leaf357 TaxID=1736350 RepID=UPI000701ECF7|nr:serine hydrolase [Sphingomonas sp. Leaf357]KQS04084.1 serine hydrolase [Sphingomonas sp. Leaf357]
MRHALASFALLIALPATAQTVPAAAPAIQPAPELQRRIEDLIPLFNGGGDYTAAFSPTFIGAVPKTAFDGFAKQLTATGGKAIRIESVAPVNPWSAAIVIAYERGRASAQIAVDPQTHQIIGLRITGMSSSEASLAAVDAGLAKLPGRTGFALAKLGAGAPEMLSQRGADTVFAIGSEFKLVILAELVRGIAAGMRHWDDTVTLDGRPLPGGGYTQAPVGTKVSLYELAERMISVSDNSATDILLRALGRDKVEAMLPVVGIRNPRGMQPFLGPLELFKLKGSPLGARWAALDIAGRRALLDGEVAAMPNAAIDKSLFVDGKPVRIDELEWFASPADIIRTLDWLRRHSETGPATRARAILAKNSGVGAGPAGKWQYLGYKGGSEPGVIAMSFLAQAKDGRWYAMSASWNDTEAAVDDARFAGLMTRAVELAAGY